MALTDIITKLVGGSAGNIIESVGAVADRFIQTPAEKEAFKAEIAKEVNRHSEVAQAAALSETEAYLKDMDSARSREIAIATSDKAPTFNKIITPLLAVSTIALTFVMFYALLFKKLGAEKDIVIYIVGALTTIVGSIISYYFGSSNSSKSKQDTISKMLNDK